VVALRIQNPKSKIPYMSILIATEDTYPFTKGDISTWCHELTHGMPEIDFKILAIVAHPNLPQQYPLSKNVSQLLKVPLSGMEDPIESGWRFPFSRALKSKIATTKETIYKRFIPLFEQLINGILSPHLTPVDRLGETLVAVHEYFLRYDYHQTMTSQEVWKSFRQLVTTSWQTSIRIDRITIGEITETLRLLDRLLLPLNLPIPPVDLIHTSSASYCGLPGIIARIKHDTPFLLTEHQINIRDRYIDFRTSIQSLFVRRFLHHLMGAVVKLNYYYADLIAPVCAYHTRWEKWWDVPDEKIKIIYAGVDSQKFCPGNYEPNSHPVVVNIGLICPLNAQLNLIEAAAIVRDRIPDVEFRFYGKPSDLDYFARCEAKVRAYKLEHNINFGGFTSEPWLVYGAADLVAIPSIAQDFPYPVIEAMLCGAAIVASDVGGVMEALGDTGLLVPPNQPITLAESILKILNISRDRRQEIGIKFRERALDLFTQERCIQTYLDTYLQLIRQSKISEFVKGYQT
jgi:polysaccharide biosynthesis protein PelF